MLRLHTTPGAFALVLLFASPLRAQDAAPPSPNDDLARRIRELADRQSALETTIEDLRAQIATRKTTEPLAGYSDKSFFLRDEDSNIVLIPKGRINVDYYHFLNRGDLPAGVDANGAKDTRPHDTLFLRRARIGFAGTMVGVIDFRLEADFAQVPTPGQYGTLTDASIVLNTTRYFELEAGQFYAPFTLENATSDNYVDFLERGVTTRFVVPFVREIGVMAFGEAPQKLVRYWVGIFDGEGQNVKNLDDSPAFIGRTVVAPLGFVDDHPKWMEDVWVGGSLWVQHTNNQGGQAAPALTGAAQGDIGNFTTQGGWSVWSSSYANGTTPANAAIRSHLAPSRSTRKFAFELNVPIAYRVGFRGEYVHQSIDLREYDDAATPGQPTRTTGAAGNLTGSGAYGEVYVWLGEEVNVDRPGLYQNPHWRGYKKPPSPAMGVMLAAKYEHVAFDVTGLPDRGKSPDPASGRTTLDVFELGANLWYTRHARVSANYGLNYIGAGDAPAPSSVSKNVFYKKADHELLFRWAVQMLREKPDHRSRSGTEESKQ